MWIWRVKVFIFCVHTITVMWLQFPVWYTMIDSSLSLSLSLSLSPLPQLALNGHLLNLTPFLQLCPCPFLHVHVRTAIVSKTITAPLCPLISIECPYMETMWATAYKWKGIKKIKHSGQPRVKCLLIQLHFTNYFNLLSLVILEQSVHSHGS